MLRRFSLFFRFYLRSGVEAVLHFFLLLHSVCLKEDSLRAHLVQHFMGLNTLVILKVSNHKNLVLALHKTVISH